MFDERKWSLHSPSPDAPSSPDGCQCSSSYTHCQKQHLALRHSPQALYLRLWTCFCIYHTVNMSLSSISLLDCCALGWQFPKATFKFSVNSSLCMVSFWESNFRGGSSLFTYRIAEPRSWGYMALCKINKKIYWETHWTLSEFLNCFYTVFLPDKNSIFFSTMPYKSWSVLLLYNMCKGSRTTPFQIPKQPW